MGVNQDTLIRLTREIMEDPLKDLGYEFSLEKFTNTLNEWDYGFFKKFTFDYLYLFINFQPGGFDQNDLFYLYIDLIRTDTSNLNIPKSGKVWPIATFMVRLNPILYDKKYKGPEWEWHFVTEEEAKAELQDAFKKLLQYGIPFLEDPLSSWKTYLGDAVV